MKKNQLPKIFILLSFATISKQTFTGPVISKIADVASSFWLKQESQDFKVYKRLKEHYLGDVDKAFAHIFLAKLLQKKVNSAHTDVLEVITSFLSLTPSEWIAKNINGKPLSSEALAMAKRLAPFFNRAELINAVFGKEVDAAEKKYDTAEAKLMAVVFGKLIDRTQFEKIKTEALPLIYQYFAIEHALDPLLKYGGGSPYLINAILSVDPFDLETAFSAQFGHAFPDASSASIAADTIADEACRAGLLALCAASYSIDADHAVVFKKGVSNNRSCICQVQNAARANIKVLLNIENDH
jgi:hypothetical protein